jgi:Ca2+-binding EF-hand superfamily protein
MTQNSLKSESIKQQLNNHERCEPYAIFSRIDREDKGFLIKEDFFRFLNDNDVNIDIQRKTIDLFIEYYDRNFDEKLDFTEFLNFILNKEQNLSRSISSQRETYKIACDEYLEKELEDLIVQALMSDFYLFEYSDMKKIEIFLNLDDKRENSNFSQNEDTKLIDLFIKMDCDQDGLISCEDLYDFVSKRRIKICQNELQNFIGLFDEDMDGFLDWNEFLFMILPSSSSFEYDLKSLQRQEEKYNEFYYQKIKNKNDSPKMDNFCYNNNYMNYNYNKDENNDYINTYPISNMKKINYNKFDKLNDIDVKN